jgi:uncharacterized protein YdgA (DUF945 family)
MRKGIAIVVAMTLLLVGLPWVIGNIVEDRVDRGLDKVIAEAPYLGIVERHYTKGWFRSEQEVTFEVIGPLTPALSPATVLADAVKEATPGVEAPDAAPAAAPQRFTLRNEILHGPVLGLSGLGLARINWRLVLSDDQRAYLQSIFGTEEPLEASTRIDFFGGGTTTLEAPALRISRKNGTGEVSWDRMKISIEHPDDLDRFSVYGKWDRLDARDDVARFRFAMRDLKLDGGARRIVGNLYDTDLDFTMGEMSYVGADGNTTSMKDLSYVIDTDSSGDFVSFATRMGTGAVESPELAQKGLNIKSMHYDVTVRRLHIETLEKFLTAIDASYVEPAAGSAVTDRGFELLKHDPEFVLDRISIETPDGEATLKGILRLEGVTEKDLKMGVLSLIARLDADLTLESPRKLIDRIDGGGEVLKEAVDGGYVELKADKARSHIEFREGELTVNGKVQDIPGLGTPPPPAE